MASNGRGKQNRENKVGRYQIRAGSRTMSFSRTNSVRALGSRIRWSSAAVTVAWDVMGGM